MRPRLLLPAALAIMGIAVGDACTAPNEQTLVISAVFPPADLVRRLPVSPAHNYDTDPVTMTVSLQMIGDSNHNTLKSNTMKYTINLCYGCLQNNVGPCCAAAVNAGLCSPAQDAPIDCCSNDGVHFTCPAAMLPGSLCADGGTGP